MAISVECINSNWVNAVSLNAHAGVVNSGVKDEYSWLVKWIARCIILEYKEYKNSA
jgi:hypothetical protein